MSETKTPVALITGASSGIGAEYARAFASRGYDLLLTGRRKEKLDELSRELKEQFPVNVELSIVELGSLEQTDNFVASLKQRNDIHALVNNAGFGYNSFFHQSDIGKQEVMMRVHITAPMKIIHAVIPQMRNRKQGTIINVSSLGIWFILPGSATYIASKLFLKKFTESLAVELINAGINLQVIAPGLTRTDFHERIGIKPGQQKDHGLIRWMSATEVVQFSMRKLSKKKILVVPGFHNRFIIFLLKLIPPQMRVFLAKKASQKMAASKEKA